MHFQACPLLCSQIVGNSHSDVIHVSRPAEPVETQRLARSAEPVVTHNHHVRFEINDNNNNINDDNNDDGRNMQIGVVRGSCKSVLVRGLTSSATTPTQQQLKATTTIDNDDNDDTARRATFNAGHGPPSAVARHKDPGDEPKCRSSGQPRDWFPWTVKCRRAQGVLQASCAELHVHTAALIGL